VATLTAHAVTVVKLYTGGKAKVNRQNLFSISAWAQEYIQAPEHWWWDPTLSLTPLPLVDNSKLTVAGKQVGSDGNVWMVLSDNSEQDITVTAHGVQHYNAWATPTKHLSHFEVLVRMPDPDGTANFTGSVFTSRDYGHAWWCLSSDAPGNIITQQLGAANLNPSAINHLNIQEGYGPRNGELYFNYITMSLEGDGVVHTSNGSDNTNRIYQIGFNELLAGLNSVQYLSDHPGIYDVKNNNCAEKVEALGAVVGVSLPKVQYPEVLGHLLPPNN
jgi:hypothetical protein